MTADAPSPLLERAADVAALEALLDAACRGEGGALLLQGVAGVGKTRMLQAAAATAGTTGLRVLRASGDVLEQDFPWGVAVQLFSHVGQDLSSTDPSTDGPGAAPDPFAGQAALVRPLLEQARIPEEVRTDPFPLLHGLYWLAADLASRQPLLLLVDDIQWADAQSLRLLHFLVRRFDGVAVAILMACRSGDPVPPDIGDLLLRLAADQAVRTRTLGTLAPASIGRLVRTQLPDATEEFCAALAAAVGGNPFLCVQLLAAVRAEGLAADDRTAGRLHQLRPDAVRQAILVRLGQLGPDAAAVAGAAAVLGSAARVDVVAAVAGLDPPATTAAIDRLTSAAILASDAPPLAFQHPIVREVVLDDLGPARLRQRHASAARALHSVGAAATDVAGHLLQTDPVAEPWAVAALRSAAALDIGRAAPARAARLLQAALDANPDVRDRPDLLLALGRAEVAAGLPSAAGRFDELLNSSVAGATAGVASQLGDALYAAGRYRDAAAAYDRGLDVLPDTLSDEDQVAEARLLAGLDNAALMLSRRPHHLRQRMDDLAADPPLNPSPADRVLMATAAGRHALAGDLPSWQVVRLADAAVAGGDLPEVLGRVILEPVTAALTFCDRFDAATAILDGVIANARERGEGAAYAGLLPVRAVCALRRGHLAAAVGDAEDAVRIAEELPGASRQALAPARRVIALAALARGELEVAAAALDVPDAEAQWGQSPIYGWFLDAVGRLRLVQGAPVAALAAFEAAGRVFTTAGGPGTFCDWRSGAALALQRLDRPADAAALAADEAERARLFGAPRGIAIALRCQAALAGDGAEAEDLLRQAAVVLEASPAQLDRALVQIDLGAALRRSGRRREARAHLREGLELARACGALAVVGRASDELAASGARRPDLALTGVAALTPSELRVARLAAAGHSNREIAEALFVTRKTVEIHLSSTYRKLQVRSRTQLPAHLGGGSTP